MKIQVFNRQGIICSSLLTFLFYFKNVKVQCQAFIFAQETFSKIAWGHVIHDVKIIYQLKKNLSIFQKNGYT